MNILKNATRFIIGGFAACAAMIACTAGSAAAQSLPATSWLPAHKAAETVYISPATDPVLAAPFESFAFKSELKKIESANNLTIYVVVTQTGSDILSEPAKGPALVRKLWDDWNTNAGSSFAEPRSLVILLTGPNNHSLKSVGVRAGSWLNGLGINRNTMSDDAGPVRTSLGELGSNPSQVAITIAQKVDALATAKSGGTASTPAKSTDESAKNQADGSGLAIAFALVGAVVLVVIVVAVRRSSSSGSSSGSVFEQELRRERGNSTGSSLSPRTDRGKYGGRYDDDGSSASRSSSRTAPSRATCTGCTRSTTTRARSRRRSAASSRASATRTTP